MNGISTGDIIGAILNKSLIEKDTLVRNTEVKAQNDWTGEFLTDFKAQWNAVNAGNQITYADYDAKDYVVTS